MNGDDTNPTPPKGYSYTPPLPSLSFQAQYNEQTGKWEDVPPAGGDNPPPPAGYSYYPERPSYESQAADVLRRGVGAAYERQRGWLGAEAGALLTPFGMGPDTGTPEQMRQNIVGPAQTALELGKDVLPAIVSGNPAALGTALAQHLDKFPEWVGNLVAGKQVPESVGQGAVDLVNTYLMSGGGAETANALAARGLTATARGAGTVAEAARTNLPEVGGVVGGAAGAYVGHKLPIWGAGAAGGTYGAAKGYQFGQWMRDVIPPVPEEWRYTGPPSAPIPEYNGPVSAYLFQRIRKDNPHLSDTQVRGLAHQVDQSAAAAAPAPPATAPAPTPAAGGQRVAVSRPAEAAPTSAPAPTVPLPRDLNDALDDNALLQQLRQDMEHEASGLQLEEDRARYMAELPSGGATKGMETTAASTAIRGEAPQKWTQMSNWTERDTQRVLGGDYSDPNALDPYVTDEQYQSAVKRWQQK